MRKHPLKKFLKKNKLSISSFARQIEVNPRLVRGILNSNWRTSPETASSIEKATGINRMIFLYPKNQKEAVGKE